MDTLLLLASLLILVSLLFILTYLLAVSVFRNHLITRIISFPKKVEKTTLSSNYFFIVCGLSNVTESFLFLQQMTIKLSPC